MSRLVGSVILLAWVIAVTVVPKRSAIPNSVSPGSTTYSVTAAGVGIGAPVAVGIGVGVPEVGNGEGVTSVLLGGTTAAGLVVAFGGAVTLGVAVRNALSESSAWLSGNEGGRNSSQKAITLPARSARSVPRKTAGDGKRLAGSRQAVQKGPVPCCSQ